MFHFNTYTYSLYPLIIVVSGTFSDNYDPTIENTHHKTIRFRKVHFATDIIDTAGMVSGLIDIILYMCTSYVFFPLHTLIRIYLHNAHVIR